MSIEEQIEIVESNIAEYGVCDITIEEYRHLKQKIRAEAIDEYFEIIKKHEDMLGCVMICQCESIAEQLKENK